LVLFEITDSADGMGEVEEAGFEIGVENPRKAIADQGVKMGAAKVVFANFSSGPAAAEKSSVSEQAFATVFVILEVLEDCGDFVGVWTFEGLIGEDEEALPTTVEGFIEFHFWSAEIFLPELFEFSVEAAEMFGALVDEIWIHGF